MSNNSSAPIYALLLCVVAVALSTIGLPYVSGFGTVLGQAVALGGWALLSAFSSNIFADQNHQFVWPIAVVLNVVLYSTVAIPVYFLFRRRSVAVTVGVLAVWLAFYLACLFVLFPATDGP